MNKKEREKFLLDNWRFKTLNFKFSRSGVCRIYDKRSDKTRFYAGGYGYDKKGTCLAKFMNHYFNNELKKLDSSKFYGLTHYNKKTNKQLKKGNTNTISYLDGACGFESMTPILEKIGFKLEFILESDDSIVYQLKSK